MIIEHLFKEGQFEVGEIFAREAQIPEPLEMKQSYQRLQSILKEVSIKSRCLGKRLEIGASRSKHRIWIPL